MKSKSTLWLIGLAIVIGGSFINGVFLIPRDIGGLARELTRLVILFGIGLLIYGLIHLKKK